MFADPIESVTRLVTLSKGLIGQGQASKAHTGRRSWNLERNFPLKRSLAPCSIVAACYKEGILSAQGGRMGGSGHSLSPGDTAQSHVSKQEGVTV